MPENPTSTPNRLRIALYAILGGLLALSGELMPDDFKEKIRNLMWDTFHISFFWIWLGFIGLLTLIMIYLEIKKESSIKSFEPMHFFDKERDKIIESFAKRYKNRHDWRFRHKILQDYFANLK